MRTKKSHIHHKWHLKIEAGFLLLLFLAGSQHALFCILNSSGAVIVLSLTSSSGSLPFVPSATCLQSLQTPAWSLPSSRSIPGCQQSQQVFNTMDFTAEMHVAGWEPEPSTISSSWSLQPGLHDIEELNPSQILGWQDINELLRVYQNCRGNLKQILCQQKLTLNVLFQHTQNEREIKVVYVASLQPAPWKFLLPEYFKTGNRNIIPIGLIVRMLRCLYIEW